MLRILVADDNDLMRGLMVRIFENLVQDAEILCAESGEEAIRLASTCAGPVHLALIDYQMTGMNGIDCAIRLRELHADIDVRIITGEFLDPILEHGESLGIQVIAKPATRETFVPMIESLMDR